MNRRHSFPVSARQLRHNESGAALVELSVCIALFLLIFFMLLDFGRMAYNYVTAEKSLQIAARMAVVRPPVCNGVPQTNQRGDAITPRFGSRCDTATGVCASPTIPSCTGGDAGLSAAGNATADAIWARVQPLLPNNATEANLRYTYSYDEDLNFLGGPFVPVVRVELINLDFQFLGVFAALAEAAGVTDTGDLDEMETNGVSFGLSVSLPGEDLALGTNG